MTATELRIGNWVEEAHSGEFGQVDMVVLSIIERMSNHSYRPIPLTEEWLERFGFEKVADNCWLNNKTAFYVDKRESHIRKGFVYYLKEDSNDFIPIDNLHQLQNLYFALTGEELTQNK